MINLLHQGQQAAQFSVGETFTGEPVEVLAGQVGDDSALVFAEGHLASDQEFEFFGVHAKAFRCVTLWNENTGNLHEGQLTDHAYKPDTDFLIFIKSLIFKDFI